MVIANQALSFVSELFPTEPDKFLVTTMTCKESLSELFQIELELLAKLPAPEGADVDIDLIDMVKNGARVRILRNGGDPYDDADWRDVSGVLRVFEQLEETSSGWGRFRAVLVPKLWLATRTKRSRIFADQSIDTLITAVLSDPVLSKVGVAATDYSITLGRASGTATPDRDIYPLHENLAQYEESDWHFLTRHLENEGLYFFFKNDGTNEVATFADATSHYLTPATLLEYKPTSTGSANVDPAEIRSFSAMSRTAPAKVAVRQYNWPTTTTLKYEETIANGTGERVLFNESFTNEDQGKELAKVRAEELVCRQNVFRGSSNARSLRPGMTITLTQHFRDSNNADYVLTEVVHNAKQEISLDVGNITISGVSYKNTFHAISKDVAWRPKRATRKPRIEGLTTGRIVSDSADTRYAVLDADSRYLVRMKYDTNATKVKRWMRMSQPSAGPASGMHFPLNPGAEVIIAHIDGDPDCPIIVGAVPNADNESPTSDGNESANAIQTRTGNLLNLDDDENASGFLKMDSSRSKVSDQRRRGIQDPLSSFTNWVAAQASGSGNAEAIAPPESDSNNGQVAGASAPRQTPAQQPGSGSGMATSPADTTPNLERAWRAFFDGDAMRELAEVGPYRPKSSDTLGATPTYTGGMSVSDVASRVAGSPGSKLSEKNIVKLLNHVVKDSLTPGIEKKTSSEDLQGKVRDLILNTAQNFEGSAAGSTVNIDIGDNFTYSLGDSFHYGDGSNSVSIGTGGFTREETLAEGTTEIETWGKQTTKTTHHGTQAENTQINGASTAHTDHYDTDTSFTYRGGATATCTINFSVQTNTEMFLGGYNCNTVNVGAFLDTTIFLIGKVEIEISAAVLLTIKLGNTAEFEMNNSRAVLNSDEVFLNDMKGALSVSDAALTKKEAALADQQAVLDEKRAALNTAEAALNSGEAFLNYDQAALAADQAALAASQAALSAKTAALSDNRTALSDMQTAAFHSIQ